MEKPKNLAGLKRLPVGTKLLLVSRMEDEPVNKVVTIVKMQGNAWKSEDAEGKAGWHYFRPAKDYTFTDDGFVMRLDDQRRSVYRWVE